MFLDSVLILVLLICLITDIKKQKIYNKVIFPGLLLVISINIFYYGFEGIKISLIGFIVGLSILLIPYFLGGMGAGDVKLLAFIGAAKGYVFVLNSAIYMALVGGVIALIVIFGQREMINNVKKVFRWIVSIFTGTKNKLEISGSSFSKKYPYGTAIVAGAVICLFFKEVWIL